LRGSSRFRKHFTWSPQLSTLIPDAHAQGVYGPTDDVILEIDRSILEARMEARGIIP
jgi:hypothetical protein